ncbi:tRNA (adenosine(37)-N6)-threonylcarbamoyltransferase complex transferase subunit TsaD [Elioraea thermophila]|uniref:tRNA (adenosine(37)-N6)-threonylcarbamoyltransferase complex transferase subunit TsaD n=1 Tax=Elioraea thermophila TaxID=2185104 RepID=UPI001E659C8F|nr:tRNA (adenosine(37)-N6)-threonylcarbamoyltransferase complex transferase subunit TsaD [Elioraea thermophila]
MTEPDRAGAVLAIETSCDETAAAVLDGAGRVLAQALWSQVAEHARFGGVVPELAARAHLARLPGMVEAVLAEAGAAPTAVAATTGPGLIGGLIVGANLAKGLALARSLPFYAVNHLEAHALSARLPGVAEPPPDFPYLTLLVSGGHCLLVETQGPGAHRVLGRTLDDAPGEAFDKVAKMLGLGWPGGPALERLAAEGDPRAVPLPRAMRGRAGCDFSFSGLKTAVATRLAARGAEVSQREAADLAASFQAAVAEQLADRARAALRTVPACATLVISGGVAANATVRAALAEVAAEEGRRLVAPPPALCTDNAVMVAWAAIERARVGDPGEDLFVSPRPRWELGGLPARAA